MAVTGCVTLRTFPEYGVPVDSTVSTSFAVSADWNTAEPDTCARTRMERDSDATRNCACSGGWGEAVHVCVCVRGGGAHTVKGPSTKLFPTTLKPFCVMTTRPSPRT